MNQKNSYQRPTDPALLKLFANISKIFGPDEPPSTEELQNSVNRLKDILRHNPDDEAGIRFLLAQSLLETGFEEDLGEVLALYRNDPTPDIRYTRALWTFRREGPSSEANLVLVEAIESNPHVPDYLLRRKMLPKSPPDFVEPGAENEAIAYVLGARESWQKTLGAIEWLAMNTSI